MRSTMLAGYRYRCRVCGYSFSAINNPRLARLHQGMMRNHLLLVHQVNAPEPQDYFEKEDLKA